MITRYVLQICSIKLSDPNLPKFHHVKWGIVVTLINSKVWNHLFLTFQILRVEIHSCRGYQATIRLGKVIRVNVYLSEMGKKIFLFQFIVSVFYHCSNHMTSCLQMVMNILLVSVTYHVAQICSDIIHDIVRTVHESVYNPVRKA